MGLFDSLSSSFDIGDTFTMPGLEDYGLGSLIEGEQGLLGQTIADPLDLFGVRAEQTQQQISDLLRGSAEKGIALQERQLERIEDLNKPFMKTALNRALPTLSSFARGGDVRFKPSQLFEQQLETGERGILRQQAGRGGIKSSRTSERLSDLVSGLIAEDVGRFEQGNLALLQQGIGSEQALTQAGRTLGGNVQGLYSNLGQGLNVAQQQKGASQAAALQGVGNALSSVSIYGAVPRGRSTNVLV